MSAFKEEVNGDNLAGEMGNDFGDDFDMPDSARMAEMEAGAELIEDFVGEQDQMHSAREDYID